MGKFSAKTGKKLATNLLENLKQLSEIGVLFGTAALSKKPNAASSKITDINYFYHTGKVLDLGIFFMFLDI